MLLSVMTLLHKKDAFICHDSLLHKKDAFICHDSLLHKKDAFICHDSPLHAKDAFICHDSFLLKKDAFICHNSLLHKKSVVVLLLHVIGDIQASFISSDVLNLNTTGLIMPQAGTTIWFQQPAHVVGMVSAAILAYSALSGHHVSSASTLHSLTHLLAFSTLVGIQIWTTFVTGVVLIKTLPRRMFGATQSSLVPVYFSLALFLSAVTLASFLIKHPMHTWTNELSYQVVALCGVVFCFTINGLYTEPQTIKTMELLYSMEDDESAGKIGNQVSEAVKEKAEYKSVRRNFRLMHGVSSLVNLLALGCSVVHLYFLSTKLHF